MSSQSLLQSLGKLHGQAAAMVSLDSDEVSDGPSPRSTSLATIIATLIPTVITAVLFLIAFFALRKPYRNIYLPRTYMTIIPEKDHTPSSRPGWFGWVHDFWAIDDKFVLRHQSLDGYLFLRFFKMMVTICFIGCCITWPILIPVNATGGGGESQLDRISFSNNSDKNRFWAHAIVAWLYLVFVMVVVARERVFYIGLRQAYLLSKSNAARLSSRTVLFLSAPEGILHENGLRRVYGEDAVKAWPVTSFNQLQTLVDDRDATAMMLEGSEVLLSMNANKKRLEAQSNSASGNGYHESGEDYTQSMKEKSRPTHRLTPLVGAKVDTIQWSRKRLSETIGNIQRLRESHMEKDPRKSPGVFVLFASQAAAQQAHVQIPSHLPLQMSPRYIGVQPKEIIWQNLTIPPAARILQGYIALGVVIATTIFWAIPIGLVGLISNVDYLADNVSFLHFIKELSSSTRSLLTGLLPPLATSILVSLVPSIFRYVAILSGEPTLGQAEIKTQNWYFMFQVIQVFLVTTFSSGALTVASSIAQDPTKVPELLAQNLPKVSNFYLSYLVIQGTTLAATNVLNYSSLLIFILSDKFLDKTPRAKYERYTSLQSMAWGSLYPKFTNLAVIAITYSCIAPLILGFATVGLFFLYLSYRYSLIYVVQTKLDTKGECYSRALQHLLVGVYLAELSLLGLFSVRTAFGPMVLMGILLAGTVIYHYTMDYLLTPLEIYLPADLQGGDEITALLEAEDGRRSDHDESQTKSQIRGLGEGWVPDMLLDPIARFLEPHVFSSPQALKAWLRDSASDGDDEDSQPTYTEEEVDKAYLNPVLSSKTPKLWLVKDEMGISKHEIEEDEAAGIAAADDGAVFDQDNNIKWDKEDLTTVPLFKRPVKY